MSTTYLYVKQHLVTGLKYFGKTNKNPFRYFGSGTYWTRHIKKYGKEHIRTLEIWGFDNPSLCNEFASKFSEENNIVESAEWANLCPENGTDGGYRPNNYLKIYNTTPRPKKHKENISRSRSGIATRFSPVMINNKIYQSHTEAAKMHNVCVGTIYHWIKTGKAIRLRDNRNSQP